jgi:adenylate cyclase
LFSSPWGYTVAVVSRLNVSRHVLDAAKGWRPLVGNIIDWSPVEKVLGIALVVLPFAIWWTAMIEYLVRHPEFVPYADPVATARTAVAMRAVTFGYAATCVAALVLQRRQRDNAILVYTHAFLYGALCCIPAYTLGLYTNLINGALVVGGFGLGLILWGPRPVLLVLGSFVLLMLGITFADQAGLIRYAPALQQAPFADGRLARTWLATIGLSSFVIMAMFLYVLWLVIVRWHEREEALARLSEQLTRTNELISRYVAAEVAQQIFAGTFSTVTKPDRRKLTLFFSDIEGFTAMADHLEPEDLARILNEYLSEMTEIAKEHGGTIDKFIGDAVMVLFGAPMATQDHDHALRAVQMGLAMQRRVQQLGNRWAREGFEETLRIRVGINSGVASVGNFGSAARMDYTAIGRQVNLAARLQVHCAPNEILLSHATWVLVKDHIPCREKGEIQLKGIERPVRVYEVIGEGAA